MRFAALFKTARRNRVCKDEEGFLRPKVRVEPFDEKIVFVVEHRLKTNTTDVAVRRSIDRVAECHVVGRHGLGNGAGCAADTEKSPRYFLAGANFCKRPVLGRIQINLQRLSVGADFHLRGHTISLPMIRCHRKPRTPFKERTWAAVDLNLTTGKMLFVDLGGLEIAAPCYSRTCSAFFAGIQPRKLFGSAA